ncbi:MAG: hypothetical protein Q9207_000896 [Kuettlingeria erythrocarpa]
MAYIIEHCINKRVLDVPELSAGEVASLDSKALFMKLVESNLTSPCEAFTPDALLVASAKLNRSAGIMLQKKKGKVVYPMEMDEILDIFRDKLDSVESLKGFRKVYKESRQSLSIEVTRHIPHTLHKQMEMDLPKNRALVVSFPNSKDQYSSRLETPIFTNIYTPDGRESYLFAPGSAYLVKLELRFPTIAARDKAYNQFKTTEITINEAATFKYGIQRPTARTHKEIMWIIQIDTDALADIVAIINRFQVHEGHVPVFHLRRGHMAQSKKRMVKMTLPRAFDLPPGFGKYLRATGDGFQSRQLVFVGLLLVEITAQQQQQQLPPHSLSFSNPQFKPFVHPSIANLLLQAQEQTHKRKNTMAPTFSYETAEPLHKFTLRSGSIRLPNYVLLAPTWPLSDLTSKTPADLLASLLALNPAAAWQAFTPLCLAAIYGRLLGDHGTPKERLLLKLMVCSFSAAATSPVRYKEYGFLGLCELRSTMANINGEEGIGRGASESVWVLVVGRRTGCFINFSSYTARGNTTTAAADHRSALLRTGWDDNTGTAAHDEKTFLGAGD